MDNINSILDAFLAAVGAKDTIDKFIAAVPDGLKHEPSYHFATLVIAFKWLAFIVAFAGLIWSIVKAWDIYKEIASRVKRRMFRRKSVISIESPIPLGKDLQTLREWYVKSYTIYKAHVEDFEDLRRLQLSLFEVYPRLYKVAAGNSAERFTARQLNGYFRPLQEVAQDISNSRSRKNFMKMLTEIQSIPKCSLKNIGEGFSRVNSHIEAELRVLQQYLDATRRSLAKCAELAHEINSNCLLME